jgi:organic hydroperoxide reductase OsmC/OhrA
MRPGADGKPWMAEVLLRPHVTFAGERLPDDAAVQALHHRAHDECFLARSVKSEVRVEPAAG